MAEPKENSEYGAFVRRAIRSYGARVGVGDVDALPDLLGLHEDLDEAIAQAVADLRAEPNLYSWSEIARRLGVTRQAAMQRWPTPPEVKAKARRAGGQPARVR